MAWTTTDLTTIETAIATGVRRIKFSDREQEFGSMDDLMKARTEIINYLTQIGTLPTQTRMVQMYTDSGY